MEYKKRVRAILGNKNLSLASKIGKIKQNIASGQYVEGLKMHPLLNKEIHKNPFFKNIGDVHIKNPYSFTGDFKKEFKWTTLNLLPHLEKINDFIILKEVFEEQIILDECKKAEETLIEIESNFGISLWSIEAYLSLIEKINGSEANWSLLSDYLKKINNPIYEFLINLSSKRVEKKLSYEGYFTQLENDLDRLNISETIKDFFLFKNLNFPVYDYTYKDLSSVVYISNAFSVIDQYLTLIDIIQYKICQGSESNKMFCRFLLNTLKTVKSDKRLSNIINIVDDKNSAVINVDNQTIHDCLNSYYLGDFEKSLKLSKDIIIERPLEFEAYEVYCKSLVSLKRSFIPVKLSQTSDKILKDVFDLFSFNDTDETCYKNLLKTSLQFFNGNIGKQIFGLLSEIENGNISHYLRGALSSTYCSQKNLYFIDIQEKIEYKFQNMLSFNFFKTYAFKMGLEVDFDSSATKSKEQELSSLALNSYHKKEYNEAIKLLKESDILDETPYYLERKLTLLFDSYLNTDFLKEALLLFVNTMFNSSLIIRKLNVFKLFDKINNKINKEDFTALIDTPILYSLMVKEYDLYEVYDEFICANDIFSVEEIKIDDFIKKFGLKKVVFFLNKTTTIDTLKYCTDYKSINDVEEHRVMILKILIDIDAQNKLEYDSEINDIYRINSIRKVLKEVDEGRLFIDVNNLKEAQTKKFKDEFNRFKKIQLTSSVKNLIGFNPSNNRNWENALVENSKNNDQYNSADYLAFKNIYIESRENFLFSKEYGLDSCLSTRIRHGALKNHIRSVFENLDLVTSKYNNNYRDNNTWKNQIPDPNIEADIQSELKEFSKKIDDFTIFIVEKLIQIQTEKDKDKNDGLFQYLTTDDLLLKFYNQQNHRFDSVETTIDIILSDLVNYTLLRVQNTVVESFKNDISKEFQKIISDTLTKFKLLEIPKTCDLLPNLIKSSTEIQNELHYLSEWFSLNTTSSSSLLDIETILNASLNLTNRINPLFNLSPEFIINKEFVGYSNLIFVFNIMFNNVIQHSKLETNKIKLKVELDVDKSEKYVEVKFTNNLSKNFEYEENKLKLEAIKNNWNNHKDIERSNKEGESGYDKIKRILLYEALAKTDKFECKITKTNISITLFFPYQKPISNEGSINN